ncbi:hypothetical protein HCJ93_15655 [Streptomyces sp. SBST2-5]|uniref:Uncharacterized protein n=1 Tax=Streptomyces composti TaxID=2720025 RepID=A0ABX1A8C5_9ACTN|nr:hypothetical protein [Streptomyces composti]NJP51465.1 hypothetical protein [Streptomyces composti]
MGLWHVIHEDGRTERCGEPFTVGDEVARPLPEHPPHFPGTVRGPR